VYETAQKLWPQLERWAVQTCGDPHLGQQLLMQACAVVTTIQDREPDRIANLPAYLEVTWKRLVLAEVAKEKAHQHQTEAVPLPVSVTETRGQLEQRILLQEIVAQMDDWTRTVFEYQVLGHTFEEMSPALGSSGHVIRTKFHKKLKKLTRQFNAKNAR
jgi:DNA-directed RNA polymerase specialized sigma24 family protein